jgi:Cas7 group CRISPR-associated protein Csh2
MSTTSNDVPRITGLLVLEVRKSNPNGDPERESSPRQRPDGKGEISPVSIKRKLRDMVAEPENDAWSSIRSELGIHNVDNHHILETRGRDRAEIEREIMNGQFISKYWDARLFGNTFLEDADKLKTRHPNASQKQVDLVKQNLRAGVAHFGVGISIAPIDIEFSTWTNKAGVETDKDRGMAPMAFRVLKHGIFTVPFFVNPSQAHKTGCTAADVDIMVKLLPYTYSHNPSVIRTQVYVRHVHAVRHNQTAGSFSDFTLLDALTPRRKEGFDPHKASETADEYIFPTWDDIKATSPRPGRPTFETLGSYHDYAL